MGLRRCNLSWTGLNTMLQPYLLGTFKESQCGSRWITFHAPEFPDRGLPLHKGVAAWAGSNLCRLDELFAGVNRPPPTVWFRVRWATDNDTRAVFVGIQGVCVS